MATSYAPAEPLSVTLMNGVPPHATAARAHAMKNCLTVIAAVSQLVEPQLTGRHRERWTHLVDAVARLRDLLADDLREVAPAHGAPAADVNVASLVELVSRRVAPRAEHACVELFVQCGAGELVGEEAALAEMLFNVIANAIEATPPGGGVFVATYQTPEGDQHWVVQDTGTGMTKDQLSELGRPYCSRREGGSGLGLALARGVVSEHGGVLRVESTAGAGTRVSAWLPRDPYRPAKPELAAG